MINKYLEEKTESIKQDMQKSTQNDKVKTYIEKNLSHASRYQTS